MSDLENKTFDEIKIGDKAEISRTLTGKDIAIFAIMSGDVNSVQVDPEYAKNDPFHKIIAHGMWGGSLISAVLGTELPGPGTIYESQSLNFIKPIGIGDTIYVSVEVIQKNPDNKQITFHCTVHNQTNEEVINGTAVVIALDEKVIRPRVQLPRISILKPGVLYTQLAEKINKCPPIVTAVVHPVDEVSLSGAIESAQENLITPILIGPKDEIYALAKKINLDISPYELISTSDSRESAEIGIKMAYQNKVQSLMKGALHTDELMHEAFNKQHSICTDKRMSHAFVMQVANYSKLLIISDAALNIEPSLEDKKDIVQNAIDLSIKLGVKVPRVAVLSAVETVSMKIKSTVDAAALCKMADRGQITGAIIDGPLAFDNVISKEAAIIKGISSPVSGAVDIIIVPDLVSGNILVKQLEYLSDAQSAGIVLGAKVPIILTSRADQLITRLASSALASIIVNY